MPALPPGWRASSADGRPADAPTLKGLVPPGRFERPTSQQAAHRVLWRTPHASASGGTQGRFHSISLERGYRWPLDSYLKDQSAV